jgi:circadian clock protein KaiC
VPTSNVRIIPSGVPLLDDWLSGVRAGGSHLLTGGPGSGKSAIALLFADAGLRHGETVAMLVNARPEDFRLQASYLHVDVATPLREHRLLLLRYRPDFLRRASHAVSPEQVVADLERLVAPHRPSRLVIDTIAPFVAGSPPLAPVVAELMAMLERVGATTLLTFPEDLSAGYDRSLEPLVQGSSAVIRLAHDGAQVRRAELLSLRYESAASAKARFAIRERSGLVAEHAVRSEHMTYRVP